MDNLYLQNHTKGTSGGLGVLQKQMIASHQDNFMPHVANYQGGGDFDVFLSQNGGKKKKRSSKRKRSRNPRKKTKTVKYFMKNPFVKGGLKKKKSKKRSSKAQKA